jgi:plastocyanin
MLEDVVESWSERVKRLNVLLWLTIFGSVACLLFLIVWFLVSFVLSEEPELRIVFISILCLPVPYLLFYLVSIKKGFSFFRRRRLRKRLAAIPANAHPRRKAEAARDWLPFGRGSFTGGINISLAGERDVNWLKFTEAENRVRIGTGKGFDILLLVEKGPLNFVSGELPGAGSWLCASSQLVEEMEGDELVTPIIHELFHRETGELKARNTAMDLYNLGTFATAFVVYYICVALVMSSVPTGWAAPQLPLFAFLVLVLWVAIKLCARFALAYLFPIRSCVAADEYAGYLTADPLSVARALVRSLKFSVGKWTSKNFPADWNGYLLSFMFVPLTRGRRKIDGQVERIEALRVDPERDHESLAPEIEKMNRGIEALAGEAEALYGKMRSKRSGRLSTAIVYLLLFASVLVVLGIGTRGNFLPVRLYLDWVRGGANTQAAEPSESGRTVFIYGSPGGAAGEAYYLSPADITVTVGETVTWINEDERDHIIEGGEIPRSPAIRPGESYSVTINRSGSFVYYAPEDAGGGIGPRGEVHAFY